MKMQPAKPWPYRQATRHAEHPAPRAYAPLEPSVYNELAKALYDTLDRTLYEPGSYRAFESHTPTYRDGWLHLARVVTLEHDGPLTGQMLYDAYEEGSPLKHRGTPTAWDDLGELWQALWMRIAETANEMREKA